MEIIETKDGTVYKDSMEVEIITKETSKAIRDLLNAKNEQIKAQQQEINLLIMEITELRESNQALKAYAENIEADKDEQARKTRQLEEGLRSTLKVLETLNYRGGLGLDIHKWLRDEMQTVNALLGGKEDEK